MTGWRGRAWRLAGAGDGDDGRRRHRPGRRDRARHLRPSSRPTSALYPLAHADDRRSPRGSPSPPSRADAHRRASSVLALPLGVPRRAVLGVLALDRPERRDRRRASALAALAVAAIRAGLTFRELGRLHEARRFARGFEEAGDRHGLRVVPRPALAPRQRDARRRSSAARPRTMVGRPIAEIVHPDERRHVARRTWSACAPATSRRPTCAASSAPTASVVDLEIGVRAGRGRRRLADALQPDQGRHGRSAAPRATTPRWPS